jgi:transcriptional/translational regulatory protein YebC/TACO1
MDIVLDAGAEDIEVEEDVAEIYGPTDCFEAIGKALADAGIKTEEAELMQKPENVVEIKDINVARQVLRMIDKLEDLDDVQNVTYNSEIDPEILEQLDAEGN